MVMSAPTATSNRYAVVYSTGPYNGYVENVITWDGGAGFDVPFGSYTVRLFTGESCEPLFLYQPAQSPPNRFIRATTDDGPLYFENTLSAPPTIIPGSLYIGGDPAQSNRGYNLRFPDGTGQTTAALIPANIVNTFNGLTGDVIGVSSVNGFTGAVSLTYSSAVTVTSTNAASTYYPTLSLGAGNTGLFIDNVTTPLSYVPSTGTLTVKSTSMTTGSNNTTITPATVTLTDGTDIATVTNLGFDHNGSSNFSLASNVGVLVGGNFSVGDYAQSSYQYNFPTSSGSNGQVLTTDGGYPATLSWTTPAGGSPSTTTQIIDFSEATNELAFTIIGVNTSNKVYSIDNIVGKTASLQNASGSIVVSGTVQSATTYWDGVKVGDGTTGSFINPISRNADIIISPPFTNGYTAGYLLGLTLTVFGDNNIYTRLFGSGITGDGYTAGLTFGDGITYSLTGLALSHTENTYVVKGVTGQSWVTANSFITCKCLGLTTADHTPEDAILEGVKFEINNIVAGVGFDIIGHAPEGTYGKYQIKCLGQ